MTDTQTDRFQSVARAKLAAVTEVYERLAAEPLEEGDKALYQRQSTAKALLTHIALLRKLLGLAPLPVAVQADPLDAASYRAMVAALDEEVGEDG